MKNFVKTSLLLLGAFISMPASASSPTEVFATCLVDTLNGKERKVLAKWIFFSIAAHPEIKSYSNASTADIEASDKYIGKLITRLLTVDCPNEMKAAHKTNPLAVQQGFELVGKVAMQELLTHQSVTSAISNYVKYADQTKLEKLLSEK